MAIISSYFQYTLAYGHCYHFQRITHPLSMQIHSYIIRQLSSHTQYDSCWILQCVYIHNGLKKDNITIHPRNRVLCCVHLIPFASATKKHKLDLISIVEYSCESKRSALQQAKKILPPSEL